MLNSWFISSSLASSAYKNSHSRISGLQQGQTWEACYGNQKYVAGDVYTRTVSFGGITVDNQTVGVATEGIFSFKNTDGFDGILGLSFYQNGMGEKLPLTLSDQIRQMELRPSVSGNTSLHTIFR